MWVRYHALFILHHSLKDEFTIGGGTRPCWQHWQHWPHDWMRQKDRLALQVSPSSFPFSNGLWARWTYFLLQILPCSEIFRLIAFNSSFKCIRACGKFSVLLRAKPLIGPTKRHAKFSIYDGVLHVPRILVVLLMTNAWPDQACLDGKLEESCREIIS